ncbi:cytochrome c biogenesis CcdA family protein [Mammaliicoccus sp. Dog046]|uniref:cytochrome c biogenesis CcdA family protein n=1 Tax=Mammaliicoccus sp. Dog046 TaxID=3034233 RepID=UPI002B25AD7B|nr:cytochrome c biogenesis protein CcdA [Mammaliicoccus sp. Dog046]WQK84455.1 cytochrome c biogenesis protein CcdA [Mammaliicoccus sp. Dog046]
MELTIFVAFGAGILSFVSPCVLPIYPAFISYITGMSYDDLKNKGLNRNAIIHTVIFLIGFSFIYMILGMSIGYISNIFISYQTLIRQIGAIIIIIFGLMILGIFQPQFLMRDRKINFKVRPSGYIGTFLIGMAFAAGWTPCNGPIIAAIGTLAITHSSQAMLYMLMYVLGFSIPFFVLTFFITRLQVIKKYNVAIMKIGGIIMIIMGVLLFFDLLTEITIFFQSLG